MIDINEKCRGYAVTSKLHNIHIKTAEHRVTIETAAEIGEGRCISHPSKKGNQYLIIPVYETLDTPPDQEKYELRYFRYKKLKYYKK